MAPRATESAGPRSPQSWPRQRQTPFAGTLGEPRARRRFSTDPPAARRGAAALPCPHRAHGAHPPAACLPCPAGLVLGWAQGPVAPNPHKVTAGAAVVTSTDSEKGAGGEQRKREGGTGVLPSGLPPTVAASPPQPHPLASTQVSSQNPSWGQRWNLFLREQPRTTTPRGHAQASRTRHHLSLAPRPPLTPPRKLQQEGPRGSVRRRSSHKL